MYISSTSKPDIRTEAIEIAALRNDFLGNGQCNYHRIQTAQRRSGVIEIHTSKGMITKSKTSSFLLLSKPRCIYPRLQSIKLTQRYSKTKDSPSEKRFLPIPKHPLSAISVQIPSSLVIKLRYRPLRYSSKLSSPNYLHSRCPSSSYHAISFIETLSYH